MRVLLATAACIWLLAAAVGGPAVRASATDDELPDGEGKTILVAACTTCHELSEVTKFKGYYSRAQWHDIVVTMVEYGAPVDAHQVEVLADYLALNLGKK